MAGLFHFPPVIIFGIVTRSFVPVRQVRPISEPDNSQTYAMGYEEAAALAQHRSLSDLRRALRQFAPLAKSEYAWGAVEALADELYKRNG